MLNISDISYNCQARSMAEVNGEQKELASFNFNANNASNYYFNINYYSIEALNDDSVAADFDQFRAMIAEHFSGLEVEFATQEEEIEEE